jgi:hypothetical protein
MTNLCGSGKASAVNVKCKFALVSFTILSLLTIKSLSGITTTIIMATPMNIDKFCLQTCHKKPWKKQSQ